MAEKERYELIGYCNYRDTETGVVGDNFVDLLNQQDKRIKELEEENKVLEGENKVGEFWHSAYKGKQLEYDMVYAEPRGIYEKNQQLKQQLAEKERQLNLSEELLIKQEKEYDEQLEKQAKIHYRHLKEKDQDKILFAVEQLEKVKEKIKKVPITDYDLSENLKKMYKQDAIRQIDNQINELKEMK